MNPITHKFFIPGTASPVTITYFGGMAYNSDADTTVVVQRKQTFNPVTFTGAVETKYARSTDLANWTSMTNLPAGFASGRYTQAIYADSATTDFVSFATSPYQVFTISSNSSSWPWYTSHDAVSWTQQTNIPITANPRTLRYLKNLSVANQANVRVSMNTLYSLGDDVVGLASITSTTNTNYGASGVVSNDRGVTWQIPSNFQSVSETYPNSYLPYGYYLDITNTTGFLTGTSGVVKMSDTSEPYAVWHGSRSINGVTNIEYSRPNLGSPTIESTAAAAAVNPLDYNPVGYHETSTMKVVVDSYGRLMITTDDWASKTLQVGLYSEGIARAAGVVQFIGGTDNNQFVIFCSGTVAKTTDGWASWTWDETTLLARILAAYPSWNAPNSTRPPFTNCTQLEDNVFAFGLGWAAVIYTTNNGTTWGHVSTTGVSQYIMQIFKAPNTPDVYVKLFNSGVYAIRSTIGVWAATLGTATNAGGGGATSYNFIFYNAADNAYYAPLSGSGGSIFKYTANANGTFNSTAPALVAAPVGFTASPAGTTSTIMQINQTGGRLITCRNGVYSYTHPKYNTIQIVDSVNKTSKTVLMSTTISTLGTSASASQIGGGLTATVVTGNTTNIRVFGDFWSSVYTTNGGTSWTQDNQFQTSVGTTTIPTVEFKYEKSFTGSLPSQIYMTTFGSGYTSDPTITISAPTGPNPVQAEVNTISRTSSISSFSLKNVGNGYLTPPTITITGGGGSGAVASVVQPIKYISYINIIDPDNLLKNPYNYHYTFAMAPAQGSQISTSATANEFAIKGTGDAYTAFVAKTHGGYMFPASTQTGQSPNFGTTPSAGLSKIIAVDTSSVISPVGGVSMDYNAVTVSSGSLPKRIFIYDRDAAGGDVIKYKYIDDFFTNLPAYSVINPIARNLGGGNGTLIDSSMYDPYAVISSITSIEAANQYDSNKTNFVTISRSVSDGTDLTVNWEFWTATYDNAAETMTLRDKIYDEVTVYPESNFSSTMPPATQRDSYFNFTAGGVKATPSTLATTWFVAKYNNLTVNMSFVFANFELKVTTDSGATFTAVTGFPVTGVLPMWNDNEQLWTIYDGTNRIFYSASDFNGPWTSVPSPTGL